VPSSLHVRCSGRSPDRTAGPRSPFIIDSDWTTPQVPRSRFVVDSDWTEPQVPGRSLVDSDWTAPQVPRSPFVVDSDWTAPQVPEVHLSSTATGPHRRSPEAPALSPCPSTVEPTGPHRRSPEAPALSPCPSTVEPTGPHRRSPEAPALSPCPSTVEPTGPHRRSPEAPALSTGCDSLRSSLRSLRSLRCGACVVSPGRERGPFRSPTPWFDEPVVARGTDGGRRGPGVGRRARQTPGLRASSGGGQPAHRASRPAEPRRR
jgi:hypothetical protein